MLFYLRRYFVTLITSIFLSLHKAFIHPHLQYAIQASSSNLSPDCQVLEPIEKRAVKFFKGLWHVPYETAAPQRPRLVYSSPSKYPWWTYLHVQNIARPSRLSMRRSLCCSHPPALGIEVILSMVIHQQRWRRQPVVANMRSCLHKVIGAALTTYYKKELAKNVSEVCSNPRYSWVTYFILSNICYFSQLVISILSTHPLFTLSIFVILSIFLSSYQTLVIYSLRYLLTI